MSESADRLRLDMRIKMNISFTFFDDSSKSAAAALCRSSSETLGEIIDTLPIVRRLPRDALFG